MHFDKNRLLLLVPTYVAVFVLWVPPALAADIIVWNGRPVVSWLRDAINFLLGIVGGVALLALIYSGILYVASGGSSDRIQQAKRIFSGALAGILLVILAYAFLGLINQMLSVGRGT